MRQHLHKAFEILSFYLRLLAIRPWSNLLLVVLGFVLRGSSVVIFALPIKAFLIVLDPTTSHYFLAPMLANIGIENSSDDFYVKLVLIGLSIMVTTQFLLNMIYQKLFINSRTSLVQHILKEPLCSSPNYHEHATFDLIPQGFESIVKVLEIVLFYASLALLILIINWTIAVVLLILLCILVFTMLAYVDERGSVRKEAYNERQTVDITGDNPIAGLRWADHTFNSIKRSSTYSELFGGLGMVIVMVLYVTWLDSSAVTANGLVSLVLVLSIRFLINYTGEISRLLGSIFQQHSMLAFLDLRKTDKD